MAAFCHWPYPPLHTAICVDTTLNCAWQLAGILSSPFSCGGQALVRADIRALLFATTPHHHTFVPSTAIHAAALYNLWSGHHRDFRIMTLRDASAEHFFLAGSHLEGGSIWPLM